MMALSAIVEMSVAVRRFPLETPINTSASLRASFNEPETLLALENVKSFSFPRSDLLDPY